MWRMAPCVGNDLATSLGESHTLRRLVLWLMMVGSDAAV